MSPYSCLLLGNYISIEPLLRDHMSYKATLSLSQRWPLKRGLTARTLSLFFSVQIPFIFSDNVCKFSLYCNGTDAKKNAKFTHTIYKA
jgi:hypothetical protein